MSGDFPAVLFSAQCAVTIAPLRRHPDLVSLLDSQVLCGETADVLKTEGDYWQVRLHHDGYTGWVEGRQFRRVPADHPAPAAFLTADYFGEAVCGSRRMRLVLGTPLPAWNGRTFRVGDDEWEWHGAVMPVAPPKSAGDVLAFAARYCGAPYFWGGRTPFGIDCSGFVQAALRPFGVTLARDTIDQIHQGTPVDPHDIRAGDLVFFGTAADATRHVGLYCGDGAILHSSVTVHEDDLTAEGIRRRDDRAITHRISGIRRVVGANPEPSGTSADGTSR